MKKILLLSLTTALISGVSGYTCAHGDEKDENHHKTEQSDASSISNLEELKEITVKIDELVKANNLKSIHEEVEKAEGKLASIAKTEVKPEKKARFDSAIKQVKSQLGKVHEASDASNAEQTTTELNKLNGAIKLLESTIR